MKWWYLCGCIHVYCVRVAFTASQPYALLLSTKEVLAELVEDDWTVAAVGAPRKRNCNGCKCLSERFGVRQLETSADWQ